MGVGTSDAESLSELIEGFWTTQLIGASVELGVPEQLAAEPLSHQELAYRCGAEPDCLRRLLRALSSVGICRRSAANKYELTTKGQLLCAGSPDSMRGRALFASGIYWRLFGDLTHVVRSGRPTNVVPIGRVGFDLLAQNPGLAGMQHAMVESSVKVISVASGVFDFSRYTRILDVGGGYGGVLGELLQRNPGMSGDIFDLGYLESGASGHIQKLGVGDRGRFIAGDFFKSVPAGYDAYLLKYIIHDWDDEQALIILRNCVSAAGPTGEIILLERIVPSNFGDEHRHVAQIDLAMMITGGRERTEQEFRALLRQAGLGILSVAATSSGCSVIRAAPPNI